MSIRVPKQPSYRLHKSRNCAVVTIGGKDHYLGPYLSPESHVRYDQLISQWKANGFRLPSPDAPVDKGKTVNEVILAFWEHAQGYYRRSDGSLTSEVAEYKRVLSILRRLYGETAATDFGPLALRAVREFMIDSGVSRGVVNQRVNRIRHVFKWAAGRELIDARVHENLKSVEGLARGRTSARETDGVGPVAESVVLATLPYLSRYVAAMVNLQLLTGARPGEVVVMRGMDLDRSGPVWLYRPGSDQGPHGQHKTSWRGRNKIVSIGPKAQNVLREFLKDDPKSYLFSPRESRDEFDARRKRERKTKTTPSQQKRSRKPEGKRQPKERYTVSSYHHALVQACLKAGMRVRVTTSPEAPTVAVGVEGRSPRRISGGGEPGVFDGWLVRVIGGSAVVVADPRTLREQTFTVGVGAVITSDGTACGLQHLRPALPFWHPNQLRHTRGSQVRKEYGLEAAQVVLGHSNADVTQVYAQRNQALAEKVAAEIG